MSKVVYGGRIFNGDVDTTGRILIDNLVLDASNINCTSGSFTLTSNSNVVGVGSITFDDSVASTAKILANTTGDDLVLETADSTKTIQLSNGTNNFTFDPTNLQLDASGEIDLNVDLQTHKVRPDADNTRDLGETSRRWATGYFNNIDGLNLDVDNLNLNGTTISTDDSNSTVIIGGTGAVQAPSGTTAQRPTTPANGMIRYNSSLTQIEGYADGTWKDLGGAGGSGFEWTSQIISSTPYSASAADELYVNTSVARTINLPAGTIGDRVRVIDYQGGSATNNITINPNGTEKIETDTSLILDVNRVWIELVYTDATQGWVILN